jgi:hypothetical protein
MNSVGSQARKPLQIAALAGHPGEDGNAGERQGPAGGSLIQIAPVNVLFMGSRVTMEWQILKKDRVDR